ncbi:NADH:flavin oxidoreductase/NADH oxidase [Fibrisoma limi BUZ 3]|uniref:NADH:flavin oxidoreductase/NADH oxidase n=1 Tax=Fibrisoma limi BUZ 3 TaxID=1185876 RepID=I2GGQ4_9BACT|nr:NADH:flavin oxidoreductase [Fibrisoma limi]CCH53079.1 NADH:flavin oxidoreductase/NADH oxidase [Fibrisoma limi BUZ 3]
MNLHWPSFFDQTALGNHRLKNRFVVAPMTRISATSEGVPTNDMGDYYEAFAAGGFAMILSEGTYTDAIASICSPGQPGIVTHQQLKGWQKITTRVRRHGAVFLCQLMHAGALSQTLTETIAPSAIKPVGKQSASSGGCGTFPTPRTMTTADIKLAVEGYKNAALNAVDAGFDGVEIHGANGYLPDQFITRYTNTRTDEYGGSVENRFRFIAEIMAAVRAVVPAHFIVGLRLSEGKVNNLAYRWEEGADMARALFAEVKKAAPDYLHIAAEGGGWVRECVYADGSSSTGIARQILACPVIANGGLHDPVLAKYVLSEKHGDLLAIGRYAIANPDFPKKLLTGEELIKFDKRMIAPSISLANTRAYFEETCYAGK